VPCLRSCCGRQRNNNNNTACHGLHINQVHLQTSPEASADEQRQKCLSDVKLGTIAVTALADHVRPCLLNWQAAKVPLYLQSKLRVCLILAVTACVMTFGRHAPSPCMKFHANTVGHIGQDKGEVRQ